MMTPQSKSAPGQIVMNILRNSGDFYVVILLVTIVAMMVIPLPLFLIDTLIALNIAFVITVLIVALYAKNTLALSTFPTILLISTIFRLALTISTTRLILSEANAGAIISTFGEFVVAGNVVVGMVIFLIITVVQFVVITKGAERIAEVGARFQLDALPGKQMSIDGELRNGDLSKEEATSRRNQLEQESQFYGAMDGAMKFVKGDAIAGLIIVAVNLIGGLTIGMAQNGMGFGEAGVIYSLLTIGDGLVSQIPALFVAITAGMIVTRVASNESRNLGSDMSEQLTQSRPILAGAGVVVLFAGFVPGFPTFIFMGISALLIYPFARENFFPKSADEIAVEQDVTAQLSFADISPIDITTVTLKIGTDLFKYLNDAENMSTVQNAFEHTTQITGLSPGAVHIGFDADLPDCGLIIELDEVNIVELDLTKDRLVVGFAAISALNATEREGIRKIGLHLLNACWTSPKTDQSPPDMDAFMSLLINLEKNARIENFGLEETSKLLERTAKKYPKLIEATKAVISLPDTTNLLKRLVSEGVPIKRIDLILNALVSFGNTGETISRTTERLRPHLARQISYAYSSKDRKVAAITFSTEAEQHIYNSRKTEGDMNSIIVSPDFNQRLGNLLQNEMHPKFKNRHVFIVNTDIRANLIHIIKSHNNAAVVLTYNDIAEGFELDVVQQVDFEG